MSGLIVFATGTETGALELIDTVDRLQKQHVVDLEDAALIVRAQGGQINIGQVRRLERSNPLSHDFWAGLIRRAFPTPSTLDVFSDDLFAASPAMMGVDDNFFAEVGAAIQPGNSALLLLVADPLPGAAMDALDRYQATVLRASGLLILEDFAIEGGVYQLSDIHWVDDLVSGEESSDSDTDSSDVNMTLGGELPGDPDFPGW
jgi:uncharacterized membrane protein